MPLYVRKIELGKWKQNDVLEGEDVSADAITNCLKTRNNTLSMWHIDEETQLDEAVLAIVSVCEHLETIDVIAIDKTDLERHDLCVSPTRGRTAYQAFANRHRDIAELSYRSLGTMAQLVVNSLRDKMNRRYTRGRLKSLIAEAILDGRASLEDLEPSVREKFS